MFSLKSLPDQSIQLIPKDKHKYSVIWMHGLGDTSQGFLDFFQEFPIVSPGTKVLLLQAPERPVTINMGMKCTSWFDIKVLKSDQNVNFNNFKSTVSMEEIEDSKKIITKYLEEEVKLVSSKNVFIGGFSQGCCMALETGLSYAQTLGGIVGLSGYLFPTTQMHESQKTTPILLVHGSHDQMIPCALSKKSYENLDVKNRQIFEHTIIPQMQHEVPLPVVKKLSEFFKKVQQ